VNKEVVKSLEGATQTLYIKGSKSRSDLRSSLYNQTTFNDSKSDTTIILRELGNAKYISYIDQKKRKEYNRKFEGVTFSETSETKDILGYTCKKIEAKLKDGSVYNVYLCRSIIPSTREYEFQFQDLPGFVLEYETQAENSKTKIRYIATNIVIGPVQNALFDIPKSGYRIL
jgi:GLPGLI family protein